jgi:16S rRNA (cytosine1402-N4)-methyltransferase
VTLQKQKMPKTKTKTKIRLHTPVLLEQVIQFLNPQGGESYLDLTAGYGGHAEAVLGRTNSPEMAVLVDRDAEAIEAIKSRFAGNGAQISHTDFAQACQQLLEEGKRFDLVLADLGASSLHFDSATRGFSFSLDGPLDMRMDSREQLDAAHIVNTYKEKELARILREYGEEPKAWQIARRIISHRPIKSTEELANVVKSAYPGHSRVHPATRTFQALRIAVNDELGQIKLALPKLTELLNPGGRAVIISFHSLEDGLVKRYFAEITDGKYDTEFILLTKKPIVPDQTEIDFNPRARSAKLRAVAKIKTKKG